CNDSHKDLLSFPTRRSSDLTELENWLSSVTDLGSDFAVAPGKGESTEEIKAISDRLHAMQEGGATNPRIAASMASLADGISGLRSEEHTSELQSRENLVCRL